MRAWPAVAVILLHWRRFEESRRCLDSLRQVRYPGPLRIYLVDNGSGDGSGARLARLFPEVRLLSLPENRGFAAAANLAADRALREGADLLLFLNNDTVVDPDFLVPLVEAAEGGPEVGAVAPKILSLHDPGRIWSVGGRAHPLTLEMVDRGDGEVDRGRWEEERERDYFTGCALLVRREAWTAVGGFDPRFFFYYEDLDLCRRLRARGYRLRLVPRSRIWHAEAASSGGLDTPWERYWKARSGVLFFRLHARPWQVPFVLLWRLGSALRTALRLALRGRWAALRAYGRGLLDGLRTPL